MSDKTVEFINKANEIHNNKFDYSKVEYINAITKVIIKCNEHGEFEQTPSDHLNSKYACSKCLKIHKNKNQTFTTDVFIKKAIDLHGSLYDYSKVNYIDSKTKITIICKMHDEFIQSPSKHLQNQGCPKCAGREKKNTTQFIEKANIIHKNKYDYSKINYINSQTKIIITCKDHGDFEQVANSHIQGYGCKKCGVQSVSDLNRKTNEKFIEESVIIHGNKFDYSKVEYINANTKVIIKCNEHGEFEQTPSDHLNSKYGCAECALILKGQVKKKTTEEFILEAISVHNNLYDYSKSIYTGCENKLIIICNKHGEFQQQPNNHLYGKGCLECAREKLFASTKHDLDIFIKKANEIHNNYYDYSNVDYIDSNTKVTIICKNHGIFYQSPNRHLQGRGCIECGYISISNKKKSNNDEFIKKANEIHNNYYDYSNVDYIDSNTKIIIICKEHGNFLIRPNNHISSKQGCPKCQIKKQHSKMQIDWLNFMSIRDNIIIQHGENLLEFNIPNTRYRADGYCQETNTIYEFHGDYWHGNPNIFHSNEINKTTKCTFGELYQKTLEKEQKIKDLGYNLVTIWENDWFKLNKSIKVLQRKYRNYKLNN